MLDTFYIYASGYVTQKPLEGIDAPVKFYFKKSTGARFMRPGSSNEVHLDFEDGMTVEKLEGIVRLLDPRKIDSRVKRLLDGMVKKKEVKSGTYSAD